MSKNRLLQFSQPPIYFIKGLTPLWFKKNTHADTLKNFLRIVRNILEETFRLQFIHKKAFPGIKNYQSEKGNKMNAKWYRFREINRQK